MTILRVRTAPGDPQKARLQIGSLVVPAALGRSGMGILKREGDGKTPVASMGLLYGFWRPDRVARPKTLLTMRPLKSNDKWCDAPNHPAYNQLQRGACSASHEEMWRADSLYNICLVLDWNVRSRKRGQGSAIFMHLARPGYMPTEGCIAVHLRDMLRVLAVAENGTRVQTF